MNNIDLAKKILDLRIETRRVSFVEPNNILLTNKTKVLYLISKETTVPAKSILKSLRLQKSNLSPIADALLKEGLILKTPGLSDKREVFYTITEAGQSNLNERLNVLVKQLDALTFTLWQTNKVAGDIDMVLGFLNFLK